jgi:hypothetical protein
MRSLAAAARRTDLKLNGLRELALLLIGSGLDLLDAVLDVVDSKLAASED